MRTWAEQQKFEGEMRTRWLESVVQGTKSAAEASDKVGMERGSFYKMLQKYGVEPPKKQKRQENTPERDALFRKACADGLTMKQTADQLGIGYSAVQYHAGRLELKFKDARKNRPRKAKPKKKAKVVALPDPQPPKPVTMADYAAIENARLRQVGRG